MKSIRLFVTPSQLQLWTYGGYLRHITALLQGRKREDWRKDFGFDAHCSGALSEGMVATWLGLPYVPLVGSLDTNTGDVGKQYQVKSSFNPKSCLIVRSHDLPDFPYILVTIEVPYVTLVGWLHGSEAKQAKYWKEKNEAAGIKGSAFFVPQSDLKPMDQLPQIETSQAA